jgi:hypothetical protein
VRHERDELEAHGERGGHHGRRELEGYEALGDAACVQRRMKGPGLVKDMD